MRGLKILVHAHVAAGGSFGFFFGDFADEGAHGDSGGGDGDGVLDGFTSDASGVDNAGFFQVNETFFRGHDVDSLSRLSFFDFGEEGGSVQSRVF